MPNFHSRGVQNSFFTKTIIITGLIIALSYALRAQTVSDITVTTRVSELRFGQLSGYDIVRFDEAYYSSKQGEPSLPSKVIKVALPAGLKVTGINILRSDSQVIEGKFDIFPSQPPRRIGFGDEIAFSEPDPNIYESDKSFPGQLVEFIQQADLAGQAMAIIRINPVQYIPSEKSLILYNSVSFAIEGTGGHICGDYLPQNASESERTYYQKSLENMVINPEAVSLQESSNLPVESGVGPGRYNYVIITSSTYSSYFQSLADWKTKKGIPATIVTTSWIYNQGGYSGSNEDKIQEFVQNANAVWGATYFLLGGDTNVIPAHIRSINGEDVPNDSYYSDYDNDWVCEVHVGRAPVQNTSEINNFKAKVLTYEKNPPLTNYTIKAALFGFDLDDYTDGEDCKVYIDNYYIPADWTMSNVYDSHSGDHEQNVKNAINAGQNLINHIDHCNEYFIGTGTVNHYDIGLTTDEVDAFYNGSRQSIVYSIGCHANAYDESECISEHFMNDTNGGCVAFVGNSRNGIYYQGDTDFYSFRFDKYFFRSIFSQNQYKVGNAFSDHKNDVSPSDDTWRYLFTGLTLLGDPEMPIWTENPQNLVVSHPTTWDMSESEFSVHVENASGNNINQAYVCLMKTNEVYLVGYTDANGDITFTPEPLTTGTFQVTATARDYLPSETEAAVQDPRGAVAGRVTANDLVALEGVRVYCTNPVLESFSNINGDFCLYGFETGNYNISFSYPGYIDTTVNNVAVTQGDTTALNMLLRPYPYDASVTQIFSPQDTLLLDMSAPVICEIYNRGTETATFNVVFAARVKYSSAIAFADTFTVANMPGRTADTITFQDDYAPALDTLYELSAYTRLSSDMYHANDTAYSECAAIQGVMIWYGRQNLSPVPAYIGSEASIDVYLQTSPDVYVADLHLCLGAMDQYMTAFNSRTTGAFHYPLTLWAYKEFLDPQGCPPNGTGWSSQSFIGFARLSRTGLVTPLDDAPWLHVDVPTKIMTFTMQTVDDSLLAGQIIDCLGPGYNLYQGGSNAGDSLGYGGFKVVEFFSPVIFRSPSGTCDYVPGDANGDRNVIGSDVTFLVNFFRGTGTPPPDSCWNDLLSEWLYSGADVNGDCRVIGSDVTFLVNYFRSIQTEILWCPETPPMELLLKGNHKNIDENNYLRGTK